MSLQEDIQVKIINHFRNYMIKIERDLDKKLDGCLLKMKNIDK
jgi:hypothetical protein